MASQLWPEDLIDSRPESASANRFQASTAFKRTPRTGASGLEIDLRGVGLSFGQKRVIDELDLRIDSGEFVAVVGQSGCGKSTLLRLLAGLENAGEGSITFDGQDRTADTRGGIRIMFQDARLLPWKSVLDNVRIGVPGGGKEEALLALEQVGLAERAKEWPSVLSGGQRQRVALARALAGKPRLLLLDEPLGALDALTRIEMQRLIERLWEQQLFTAVLVTHDVSEAVALADRVVLVEQGRIAIDVDVELARPRDKDSGFAFYEKLILDRVMQRKADTGLKEGYAI